jgi:hypothetical protein
MTMTTMNGSSGDKEDNGGDSNGDADDDNNDDDDNDNDNDNDDKMPLPPCPFTIRHVARYSCHSANQYTCFDWQSGRTI